MGKMRRSFTKEFKQDAVSLVLNQGYKVAEAARSLGVDNWTPHPAQRVG